MEVPGIPKHSVIRIYTEFTAPRHLQSRTIPNPIIKYLDCPAEARGNPDLPFQLVGDPAEADLLVLPYEWGYYVCEKRQQEAQALADKAASLNKQLLVWHRGDLCPLFPFGNYIACQSALYRSRLDPRQVAVPYFIDDPLPRYTGGELRLRDKRDRPTVGFCGYGKLVWAKVLYGTYQSVRQNYQSRRGQSAWDTMPPLPAVLLRARAIHRLERAPGIETNFLLRRRAFATLSRVVETKQREIQKREYFDTILNSDYTLCVRGYGNWSVRLWETLACGRIPVFVDTDCVLPDVGVCWKDFCVWVDRNDLDSLPEILRAFHARLSPADFREAQQRCRRLWVERISRDGFMRHLAHEILPPRLETMPRPELIKQPSTAPV